MLRWVVFLVVPIAGVVLLSLGAGFENSRGATVRPTFTTTSRPVVIGYLPYWDLQRAAKSAEDNRDSISELSPFWYTLDPSGSVTLIDDVAAGETDLIAAVPHGAARVTPSIANVRNGAWDPDLVGKIINDPAAMERHIDQIVKMVVSRGYDGVDLDYENLHDHDRDAFSAFVAALAAALHRESKTLSVVVYAKVSEPGYSGGHRAQDWAAIGRSADQVRIMVYDYHWSTSAAGPLAPLSWVDEVAAFAVAAIPREKIVLGFGLYGYDWVGRRGETIMWQEAVNLAHACGANVNRDPASLAPWFRYVDSAGRQHEVWFEDAESIGHKLDIMRRHGIGGVFFWRLGGEDPQTWEVVRVKLGLSEPSPTPTQPQYLPAVGAPGPSLAHPCA